jgi:hypothetical protein
MHFSDMDIDSLIRLAGVVDEEHRFGLYKRIGDLCLFILGIFPKYVIRDLSFSKEPHSLRRWQHSEGDYEELGRRFYRLAAGHREARLLNLSGIFCDLEEKFTSPKNR